MTTPYILFPIYIIHNIISNFKSKRHTQVAIFENYSNDKKDKKDNSSNKKDNKDKKSDFNEDYPKKYNLNQNKQNICKWLTESMQNIDPRSYVKY